MKSLRPVTLALLTACVCFSAGADDGLIYNKSMSRSIQFDSIEAAPFPDTTKDAVVAAVPEAEHAFIDMMKF